MARNSVKANVPVVDHDVAGPPRPDDFHKVSAPLTRTLTAELDEAQRHLRIAARELLLAALGRTIARTIGVGEVAVDVVGNGDSTVSLPCTTVRQATATKALRAAHRAVVAAQGQTGDRALPPSDICFVCTNAVPETAYRQALPTHGHALELRTYRGDGVLQMDWWYDTRRLEAATVDELSEQFTLALVDLTTEAAPLVDDSAEMTGAGARFAFADS